MSEMNNVTTNNETAPIASKWKPNWVIMIIAWVLAIPLIIIGIVSCSKGDSYELSLDSTYYKSTDYYETCEFTFTPSWTDDYYFYVRGGILSSITYGDGYTKSKTYVGQEYSGGYYYDVYKVSLSAGKEYTFNVQSTGYTVYVKITDSDPTGSNYNSSYWGY